VTTKEAQVASITLTPLPGTPVPSGTVLTAQPGQLILAAVPGYFATDLKLGAGELVDIRIGTMKVTSVYMGWVRLWSPPV